MNIRILYQALALCFLGCVMSLWCRAQVKLKGQVRAQDGDPLAYATLLVSQNDGVPAVRTADSTGHFVFSLKPRNYVVTVYALGFEKEVIPVLLHTDTMLRIVLKPLSGSLKAVTVAGSRPVVVRKKDRLVYDVAESLSASGASGLEVLGKVPGVRVNLNGISLAARGSAGIMVNGTLLHMSGKALAQYLQSMSASQISKIELITHPSAAQDADGGAGLINIITARNLDAGFSGDVSASLMRFLFTNPPDYGVSNFGYGSGGANLYYNHRRWSAYANLSYSHGRELEGYGIDIRFPDKHWAMGDTGDYRHASWNLLAGADYDAGKFTTIGFQYNAAYELYRGADHVTVPIYGPGGRIDSTLRTFANYEPIALTNALNLHVVRQLKGEGKLTLNADYFNYYRTDQSDLKTSSYGPDGHLIPGATARYVDTTKQNILIYTTKADLELPTPFAKINLGGKLSFIHNYSNIYYYHPDLHPTELDSLLSNEFVYRENTLSLYGSGLKQMGSWTLEAGVRLEYTQTEGVSYFLKQRISHHYLRLFPSLVATFQANADNTFSVSYNRRINRPTFWTLNPYKSIMTPYSYVEGNPYLEPEYITAAEVSHTYKKILISSLYLNLTDNGFTAVTIADPDVSVFHTTPYNFIRTQQFGVSESVTLSPFWWLEASTQLNGYYTQAHSSIRYIGDVSGFGWYVASNNSVALNRAKTVSAAVNFWCQFPEVDHIGKSDTYYKLDLGLSVLTLKKKLDLSLNATDLLQSSVPTIHTSVNNLKETFTNFQVFSNIKLSASWQFGGSGEHHKINTGNEDERNRLH